LSIYQELQSFYQNRRSDIQALGSAVQSGDLSTAQQAYSQLVSLGQSGPFSNSEPFYRSDRAQDFEAIGQALSSGDLASAQAAFAKLQQTFGQSKSSSAESSPAYTVDLSGSQSSNAAAGASSSSGSESIYQQLQAFRSERQTSVWSRFQYSITNPGQLPERSRVGRKSPPCHAASPRAARRFFVRPSSRRRSLTPGLFGLRLQAD
jgi:hypothetical protein